MLQIALYIACAIGGSIGWHLFYTRHAVQIASLQARLDAAEAQVKTAVQTVTATAQRVEAAVAAAAPAKT